MTGWMVALILLGEVTLLIITFYYTKGPARGLLSSIAGLVAFGMNLSRQEIIKQSHVDLCFLIAGIMGIALMLMSVTEMFEKQLKQTTDKKDDNGEKEKE